MTKNEFRAILLGGLEAQKHLIQDEMGQWTVKGFIDNKSNLYTISTDTKVLSKILEIQLFPALVEIARVYKMKLELASHQNHYPDCTFVDSEGNRFAVDIKSTYMTSLNTCNGFTLGSYTGYFRNRASTKNILYPYSTYKAHFVLGILYKRNIITEREMYNINDMGNIPSAVGDFIFILHEKYKLATKLAGSGNTKNIGGVKNIQRLINGQGDFESEDEFDRYWMNY